MITLTDGGKKGLKNYFKEKALADLRVYITYG